MRSSLMSCILGALGLLSTGACSAAVQSGLPPLVKGCSTAADCSAAGPQYQCVAGACAIASCTCDSQCPAGLQCDTAFESYNPGVGECLVDAGSTPCLDAGGTTGSTTGTGTTGTGGTTSSTSGTSGTSSGGPTASITISDFVFSPNPLVVAAGTTITVTNLDAFPHTATAEADAGLYVKGSANPAWPAFDTGDLAASGGTATIVVPSGLPSGTTQPYFCAVHRAMMGNPIIQIQ